MHWLKNVLVDIAVTIFIVAAVWLSYGWLWWVLAVYTGLLLVAKLVAAANTGGMLNRAQKGEQVPAWFLHGLYAGNVALLGLSGWWMMAVAWVAIWVVSFLADRKG